MQPLGELRRAYGRRDHVGTAAITTNISAILTTFGCDAENYHSRKRTRGRSKMERMFVSHNNPSSYFLANNVSAESLIGNYSHLSSTQPQYQSYTNSMGPNYLLPSSIANNQSFSTVNYNGPSSEYAAYGRNTQYNPNAIGQSFTGVGTVQTGSNSYSPAYQSNANNNDNNNSSGKTTYLSSSDGSLSFVEYRKGTPEYDKVMAEEAQRKANGVLRTRPPRHRKPLNLPFNLRDQSRRPRWTSQP